MTRLANFIVAELNEYMAKDKNIWAIDGDLADSYGLELIAGAHSQRFIMAGIAEQNMVCVAAGMASIGANPWVFSFAAFLVYRAADQIRTSVSQTKLPVVFVGSHAGGLAGKNGKSHQSLSDVSIIGGLGNIDIWAPCDELDAAYVVKEVYQRNNPSYIRTSREETKILPGEPGIIRYISQPEDILIFSTGIATQWAFSVYEELLSHDIRVGILHISNVLSKDLKIVNAIRKSKCWFVIEDHKFQGGLGTHLIEFVKKMPTEWFGWPNEWDGSSALNSIDLLKANLIDTKSIAHRIITAVK